MTYTTNIVIRIVIAAAAAVIFGNGSVVAFNRLPQKWFEDFEDDVADTKRRVLPPRLLEADNAGRQRLPSTPWKYIFTGLFLVTGVYLAITSGAKFETASLMVLAVVLEMAIADRLYRIVPDQLQILLAITAIGFIGFYENWWEPLAGAGVGLALGLMVFFIGLLLFKKPSIGGADLKFYTTIGLVTGRRGAAVIFVLTTLFMAIQSTFRLATGKSTMKEADAMLPAAFAATLVYLLFLRDLADMIIL